MILLLLFIAFLYLLFNISLIILWLKIPIYNLQKTDKNAFISVIIPVRNEEKNIFFLLENLANQNYSKDNFEVIIADDNSSDNTLEIVKKFQEKNYINLIINQLGEKKNNTSPKKRAINSSIQLAKGELITTTDGDCRVTEKWLETINDFYQKNNAQLISGAVTFTNFNDKTIIQKLINSLQIIEFSSLIGTGACAMFFGKPNMCNGANLTYKKSAFYEVNGFEGNEDLASGDDEFLMHKIAKLYPEDIHFLKSKNVIVETVSHQNWKSFYNQRKRWASKWKRYQNPMTTVLAIFIFLANFLVILAFSFWLLAKISNLELIIFLFLKFSAEFVFLALINSFLKHKKIFYLIPLVQLIYPFYVVFFGIVAQGKGYEWKGRKLE